MLLQRDWGFVADIPRLEERVKELKRGSVDWISSPTALHEIMHVLRTVGWFFQEYGRAFFLEEVTSVFDDLFIGELSVRLLPT